MVPQGRSYLCKRLDLRTKTAVVRPADLKYYTKTRDYTDISITGGQLAYPLKVGAYSCEGLSAGWGMLCSGQRGLSFCWGASWPPPTRGDLNAGRACCLVATGCCPFHRLPGVVGSLCHACQGWQHWRKLWLPQLNNCWSNHLVGSSWTTWAAI